MDTISPATNKRVKGKLQHFQNYLQIILSKYNKPEGMYIAG
jgi:hypothetical protein